MKNARRFAALLLVLTLTAALAAGCAPAEPTTTPQSTADASSTQPSTQEEKKDLTFHYAMPNSWALVSPAGASDPERLKAVEDYIYEQTGIRFTTTILSGDAGTEQLNLMLADGSVDVFNSALLKKGGARALYESGIIQDISGPLKEYGDNVLSIWSSTVSQDFSERMWAPMTLDSGEIIGIATEPPTAGCGTYVRKDWLEKYNLPAPTTFEELENCFKVIKENDPAGNGETVPLLPSPTATGGFSALAAGFMDQGYSQYYLNSEGKADLIVYDPGYREFVTLMASWYKKGYIHKEYSSLTDSTRQIELNSSGKVFAFSGWHSAVTNSAKALQEAHGGEWVLLEDLQGPKGNVVTMGAYSDNGYVVAKNSKNAEAVIRYLNWEWADLENYLVALNGIKGVDWEEGIPGELKDRTLKYVSEKLVAPVFAFTMQMDSSLPGTKDAYWFYRNRLLNPDVTKPMAFSDQRYLMNLGTLANDTPSADVDRMVSEEIAKFIMNSRPIEEYDAFLLELKDAGADQVSEELTARYNAAK